MSWERQKNDNDSSENVLEENLRPPVSHPLQYEGHFSSWDPPLVLIQQGGERNTEQTVLCTQTHKYSVKQEKTAINMHMSPLCLPLLLILTALCGLRSIPAVSNRAVDSTMTNLCT